jgi:hypothetical protein
MHSIGTCPTFVKIDHQNVTCRHDKIHQCLTLDSDDALHHSGAMPKRNPDELLTSVQSGAIIDRSYRTVIRAVEQGELQYATKLPGPNGAYLFRRGDVEAYAERLAAERAEQSA